MDADYPGSLRFRLFGFPVVLNWTFLIFGLFVATGELPIAAKALFFPVAAGSVLLHELGHAVAARASGARVESVVIFFLGGLTTWRPSGRLITSNRRIMISAAGSAVQIAAGMVVFVLSKQAILGDFAVDMMDHPFDTYFWQAGFQEQYVAYTAGVFVWISVLWGLVNWLPIGGLDGGQIARTALVKMSPRSGLEMFRGFSIVAGAIAAIGFYMAGYSVFALLIVMMTLQVLSDRSSFRG